MTVLRIILFTLLSISTLNVYSTTEQQYYNFDNLGGITQNLCIRAITQSSDGMIWLATESGLYSYDGYHLIHRPVELTIDNIKNTGSFNCILNSGDSLLIGCNKGVLSFNLKTYSFQYLPYARGEIVISIVKTDQFNWVATENSIYKNGTKLKILPDKIVSMYGYQNYLYIGTASAVYCLSTKNEQFEKITGDISYATCFQINAKDNSLWIGSSTFVTKWLKTGKEPETKKSVPVAKSLYIDNSGNTLVGTDNGIFVIGSDNEVKTIKHDSRREDSLSGDIIWCIFQDRNNNIWIGTNSGVSLIPENTLIKTYTLPSITGEGSGNQFYCSYIDSKGRYWLGGSNGILCINHLGKENQTYKWYRMDNNKYHLPHNRVRDIIETLEGQIIIGGDMGVLFYNEETFQFKRYLIKEDPYNWVYSIEENSKKELAITTFTASYIVTVDLNSKFLKVRKISLKEDSSTKKIEQKELLDKYCKSGNYLSAFYNPSDEKVIFGGTDRFSILDVKYLNEIQSNSKISVTDIKINNSRFIKREEILENKVNIEADVNIVELLFSDFNYRAEMTRDYFYRIDNGEWLPILNSDNSIVITNLKPGKFTLYIKPADNIQNLISLELTVKANWYASITAKIIYLLLFTFLLYSLYKVYLQAKRSKIENDQHNAIVNNARQKEKELLSNNEFLSSQLRMRLLTQASEDGLMSQDEKFLLKITRIIEENMSNIDLNVNLLCEISGYSSKQMYRKIKALTGMTAVAYIRDQRLKKAASLLSKGTFSVSEVMYLVGFSNASYFTRCFTEQYSTSPSEYNLTQKEI